VDKDVRLYNLLRMLFREWAGELVRILPGEGRPEIWDREVEVCSSEVSGSK
jgi:hypothetical protein